MGEVTLIWFALFALLAVALVVGGAVLRLNWLVAVGACLLVSLAGAWVVGPLGIGAGLVVGGLLLLSCRRR